MTCSIDIARSIRECGVESGARICVALSGGRDSVALLHLAKDAGFDVCAVNVEHGIRGEESKRDTRFAKKLCDEMGVTLFEYSVDALAHAKRNGLTVEQAARELRYRAFNDLLDSGKCDYIALAHHRDDQVETVLMRVLRGTGVRGLVGMKKASGRFIRPLLDVSREEIDRYIAENGFEYVDDSTNDDPAYTRNFLRKEISSLKTRFPKLDEAVMRLSQNAEETEDYVDSMVPEPSVCGDEAFVNVKDLADPVVAKKLILKAAARLNVNQDIETRHFPLVFALANGESGKHIELTHGLDVHKQGDHLVFALRKSGNMPAPIPFGEGEWVEFGVKVEKIEASSLPKDLKGSGLYLACEKIPSDAVLRGRKEGDRISKFGGGSKSLGDFLTDKKVPLRTRDSLAVVASGNDILAVVGVDISSKCAVDEGTKFVYKLTDLKPY